MTTMFGTNNVSSEFSPSYSRKSNNNNSSSSSDSLVSSCPKKNNDHKIIEPISNANNVFDQRTFIESYDSDLLSMYQKYVHDVAQTSDLTSFKDFMINVAPIQFGDRLSILGNCNIYIQVSRSQTRQKSPIDNGPILPISNVQHFIINIDDKNWFARTCDALDLSDIQTMSGMSVSGCDRVGLCKLCAPYADYLLFFGVAKTHQNPMFNKPTEIIQEKSEERDGKKFSLKKYHVTPSDIDIPKHQHGKNAEYCKDFLNAVKKAIHSNLCSSVFNSIFFVDIEKIPNFNSKNFSYLFIEGAYSKYLNDMLKEDVLNNQAILAPFSCSSFKDLVSKYGHVQDSDVGKMCSYIEYLIYSSVHNPIVYTMITCMSDVFSCIVKGCIYLESTGSKHMGIIYEIKKKYTKIFDEVLMNRFNYISIVVEKMMNEYVRSGICRGVSGMNSNGVLKQFNQIDKCISSCLNSELITSKSSCIDPYAFSIFAKTKKMQFDITLYNSSMTTFINLIQCTPKPFYYKWFYAKRMIMEQERLDKDCMDTEMSIRLKPSRARMITYSRDSYAKTIYKFKTSITLNSSSLSLPLMQRLFSDVHSIIQLYFLLLYNSPLKHKKYESFKCFRTFERPDLKFHIFIIPRKLVYLCKNINLCVTGDDESQQDADDVLGILKYMEDYQVYCPVSCLDGEDVDPSRFDVTDCNDDIRLILNRKYWINPISGSFGSCDTETGRAIPIGRLSEYRHYGANMDPNAEDSMNWTRYCYFLFEQ